MALHSAMFSSKKINEEADHDSGKWNEAIGTRFKPTDEVLTGYYLAEKVSGRSDGPIFPLIKDVYVYQHEPSKLPSMAHNFGDGNMYFFSPVHQKYGKGKNMERKAGDGCWKKSEKLSYVYDKDGAPIGTKTSLAYHKNDPKSGKATIKTQWLMKEYMLLEGKNDDETKMTLCVVYYQDKKRKQRDCEIENQLYDNENNQSSQPYVEELEGSSSSATAPRSLSGYFLPQTENKNLTISTCPDISSKRQCLYPCSSPVADTTLEQSLPSDSNYYQNMPIMMNGSWEAPAPNYNPSLYSSSNLAAPTFEKALLSSDPNPNMPNMMCGSWSAPATTDTDYSIVYTPNNEQGGSIFSEYLENCVQRQESDEFLDLLITEFLNDNDPDPHAQPDLFENPSLNVVPSLSNTIPESMVVNHNQDPRCLNSAETLRHPAPNVAF